MITLHKLNLQNVVLFKEATLPFRNGITVVTGQNLNRTESNASNAVGKSMLLSCLPNIVLDTTPLAFKNGKKAQYDAFGPKTELTLSLTVADNKYVITKQRKGLSITKDGVNLELRTPSLARAFLEKLLPYNAELFFTLVYLDVGRPHIFQSGTPTQRIEFLTQLFHLDDLDELRRYFKREEGDLRETRALYDRASSELAALPQTEDSSVGALENLSVRITKLQKTLRHVTKQASIVETYRKIFVPLLAEQKVLQKTVHGTTRSSVKRELNEAEANQEQRVLRISWEKRLSKLRTSLPAIERNEMQTVNEAHIKYEQAYKDLPEKVGKPDVAKPKYSSEQLRRGLDKQRGMLAVLKERLALLDEHEHADGSCELCGGPIDADKIRKELTSQLTDCQNKIRKIKQMQEAQEAWTKFDTWKKAYNLLPDKPKYSAADISHSMKYYEAERLLNKEEPAEPKQSGTRTIKELRILLAAHDKLIDVERNLRHCPNETPSESLEELLAKQKRLDRILTKINAEHYDLVVQAERHKQQEAQRTKLKGEIAVYRKNLRDAPLYEALLKAYDANGLKLIVMQRITKQIENNLNKAAKLVLPEPFRFEFSVKNRTTFDAMAVRLAHGKHPPSDIRTLSGAERRMFNLLFLLAVLPLVPPALRFDTVILDEPEASLDPPMQVALTDRLLPMLQKLIPKIVIVSPQPSMITDKTKYVYTVTKRGKNSSVEKTHG